MALSTYEKYEQYWHILHNNQDMIRFSEVKAGLVISIFGVLFSIMLSSVSWIRDQIGDWSWYLLILVILFMASTLVSLFFAFRCFMPRFENKNPTSVVYFGDIVSDFREYMAYHRFLEDIVVKDDEMSIQLAEQIHTNSVIATRKFQAVSKAIKLMLVSVFLLVVIVMAMLVI